MPELDQILERARQNRAARQSMLDKQASKPMSPEQRFGSTLFAGDRVFDLITGQEAEVVTTTRESVVVPATE